MNKFVIRSIFLRFGAKNAFPPASSSFAAHFPLRHSASTRTPPTAQYLRSSRRIAQNLCCQPDATSLSHTFHAKSAPPPRRALPQPHNICALPAEPHKICAVSAAPPSSRTHSTPNPPHRLAAHSPNRTKFALFPPNRTNIARSRQETPGSRRKKNRPGTFPDGLASYRYSIATFL